MASASPDVDTSWALCEVVVKVNEVVSCISRTANQKNTICNGARAVPLTPKSMILFRSMYVDVPFA